jgi:hypothetical protein
MERKRVGGRFVRENLDGDGGAKPVENTGAGRAPKPKNCRTFTRAKVAEALPEIVKTFVEEAKKGSMGQLGRLTQLEERVERHERSMQRMKGLAGAAGGLLTVFHLAIDYFRR